MFKETFGVQVSIDPKIYGLLSQRSGGITSVIRNDDSKVAIVSETLLKLHDRLKTDVANDMYVKANFFRSNVRANFTSKLSPCSRGQNFTG